MVDKQVLLNAIDGVLAQVATAHAYYESHNADGLPLQAVFSSLSMLRLLVDDSPAETEDGELEPGECQHVNMERQIMGGGNWYDFCPDCNEIVAQSSDS